MAKEKLWKGTLKELIEMAKKDKKVAERLGENAAQRLYNAVVSYGVEEKQTLTGKKIKVYKYFQKKVYGHEIVVDRLMNILKGMAASTTIGRPFLIMVGPPGSGKSTIAEMLRKAIIGTKAYRIVDSPWNENPLKAIPEDTREKIANQLGIKVPLGDVSAWVKKHYPQVEDEEWEDIPVEEYKIKRGQGTAVMGTTDDPANVDLSKMIGSQNLAKMTELSESDPDSWDWKKGALIGANNGILEIVEILILPAEFYKPFSQISQEACVEIPGIEIFEGLDVVIIGHTNEAEYKRFLSKEGASWLRDRCEVINVPYVLNYQEEARIYKKLVNQTDYRKVSVSPRLYKQIAKFAVATRLVEDEKVDFYEKVKLYAGEDIERELDIEIEDLIEFGKEKREGMFGISPRTITKILINFVFPKTKNDLFILDLIDEVEKFLLGDEDPTKKDRPQEVNERIPGLLSELRKITRERIFRDVINCFLSEHQADVENYFELYIRAASQFIFEKKENERDEEFMRRIEEKIGITKSGAREYRLEVLARKGKIEESGTFSLNSFPRLKKAIEELVLEDLGPIIQLTLISEDIKNKEEKKERRNSIIKKLQGMGYSEESAKKAIEIAADILRQRQ